MAFRHTSTLTTDNSNTYADTDAWIAEHGPCGVENTDHITNGTLTLSGNNAVIRVLEYADEAAKNTHFADGPPTGKAYTVSNVSTETF